MNWDRFEGSYKQYKGKMIAQWGKLTDNDVTEANGRREELAGVLQERYGYAKEEAERELDDFVDRLPE